MMKNNIFKRLLLALTITLCFLFALPFLGNAKLPVYTANASNDAIQISAYDVQMDIKEDRQVCVHEKITVKFLQSGLTMFYRSLPIEKARYANVSASCEGNDAFSYYVADNPDYSDFLDINCVGGVKRGVEWTYDIYYTMQNGLGEATKKDGMIIDVIPFGFMVPLHNVTARVSFPFEVGLEDYTLYKGFASTQSATDLNAKLSADGKALSFSASVLPVVYNSTYDEYVAQGVTLDFAMRRPFVGFVKARLLTDGLWKICLVGAIFFALAFVIRLLTRKPHELIPVVNIKAPDEMDPMHMGKILDGTVDTEDITSMIYYFANKGYLEIDLANEDNPILIKKSELPATARIHEKTLFDGLFASGDTVETKDLQYKFYNAVDKAKLQLPKRKMYQHKSVFGYVAIGVCALLCSIVSMFVLGLRVSIDYVNMMGFMCILPVVACLAVAFVKENYRYKWSNKIKLAINALLCVVLAIYAVVFALAVGEHISTELERVLVLLFAYAILFLAMGVLSREEKYVEALGDIVGFKDFIVHTEEDKIQFMLQENPQLYYKILPYAQVLGVTNAWEEKFANIVLSPPDWCQNYHLTMFDYMIFNRCMTRAFLTAMARPQSANGTGIGRSGGGGFGGGFGGGGFGGGGGGAR